MSESKTDFELLFGFMPLSGTAQYKAVERAVVIAKLKELAKRIWQLRESIDTVGGKYQTVAVVDASFEVVFSDLNTVRRLDMSNKYFGVDDGDPKADLHEPWVDHGRNLHYERTGGKNKDIKPHR